MAHHQFYTLSNGLRIIYQPTVSTVSYCGFTVNAGTRDEFSGEFGMAHFVEHLIGNRLVVTIGNPDEHHVALADPPDCISIHSYLCVLDPLNNKFHILSSISSVCLYICRSVGLYICATSCASILLAVSSLIRNILNTLTPHRQSLLQFLYKAYWGFYHFLIFLAYLHRIITLY